MEIRRLKADLLFNYKIFHKLVDLEEVDFFVRNNSNNCGHNFKFTIILKNYLKVTSARMFFLIVQCLFGMNCQMNGFHVTVLSALKVDLNLIIHLNTVRVVDKLFCVHAYRLTFCT